MRVGPKFIEEKLYRDILRVMPLPCVDVVVVSRGKFLLGKRANKPAKGKWWLVGGRLRKWEMLRDAARRHIEKETGIKNAKIKKFLGIKELFFRDSVQGPPTNSLGIAFLADLPLRAKIKPRDTEFSELRWFSKIDKKWPGYVKFALRSAGFK